MTQNLMTTVENLLSIVKNYYPKQSVRHNTLYVFPGTEKHNIRDSTTSNRKNVKNKIFHKRFFFRNLKIRKECIRMKITFNEKKNVRNLLRYFLITRRLSNKMNYCIVQQINANQKNKLKLKF